MSDKLPEEFISAYLDGELSPEQMDAVRQQLADSNSPQDARSLKELREVQNRLRALPSFELDNGFAGRVLNRIDASDKNRLDKNGSDKNVPNHSKSAGAASRLGREEQPSGFDSWRIPLAAICALAAMILLTLFLNPPHPLESTSELAGVTASEEIDETRSKKTSDDSIVSDKIDEDGDDVGLIRALEDDVQDKQDSSVESGEVSPKGGFRRDGNKDENIEKKLQKRSDGGSGNRGSNKLDKESSTLIQKRMKKGSTDEKLVSPGSRTKSPSETRSQKSQVLSPPKNGFKNIPQQSIVPRGKSESEDQSRDRKKPGQRENTNNQPKRNLGQSAEHGGGFGGGGGSSVDSQVDGKNFKQTPDLSNNSNWTNSVPPIRSFSQIEVANTTPTISVIELQVPQSEFENNLVEQTLLENNISCTLPKTPNTSTLSTNQKEDDRQRGRDRSKDQIADRTGGNGQLDSRLKRVSASRKNLRYLFVDATDQEINNSLLQMKNVTITPMLRDPSEPNPQQQLRNNIDYLRGLYSEKQYPETQPQENNESDEKSNKDSERPKDKMVDKAQSQEKIDDEIIDDTTNDDEKMKKVADLEEENAKLGKPALEALNRRLLEQQQMDNSISNAMRLVTPMEFQMMYSQQQLQRQEKDSNSPQMGVELPPLREISETDFNTLQKYFWLEPAKQTRRRMLLIIQCVPDRKSQLAQPAQPAPSESKPKLAPPSDNSGGK